MPPDPADLWEVKVENRFAAHQVKPIGKGLHHSVNVSRFVLNRHQDRPSLILLPIGESS
jgi:hypothetical protein